MREYKHDIFNIHTAEDVLGLYESPFDKNWSEKRRGCLVRMFTKRAMFRELIDVWQKAKNLGNFVILEAHGNFINGQWVYYENSEQVNSVQGWVDEMDGIATALMITSCNPVGSEVASQTSLIMHPGRLVGSWPAMVHTQGLIRLFVPGEGYIERDYKRIRKVIDVLKSSQP